MRSILLCEGSDDLWFSAYYLHKVAGWDDCTSVDKLWPNFKVSPLNKRQKVQYFSKNSDSVAIWCVSGKDSFGSAISTILDKFVRNYPNASVDSIVLLRDRDVDTDESILRSFSTNFADKVTLVNKESSTYTDCIDGCDVSIKITPVIIPFDDCGAIESILMNAIREANSEGSIIVEEACKYIDVLANHDGVGQVYLKHVREIVKAKYAATIAATNPGHSTALFQDLVLSCPWETSTSVKNHFDVVLKAVSSE